MKNPDKETKGPILEGQPNLSDTPGRDSDANIAGRVTEKGNKSNARTAARPGGAQGPTKP